ncbi:MAG: 50S ribosomal protein L10 [Microgenomates group bacterium]
MVNQKRLIQLNLYLNLLEKANNFLIIGYKAISHQALENLRKELKKYNAQIKVIKNTIFEKTVNRLQQKNLLLKSAKKQFFPLKENSALIILKEDYISGLKILYNEAKNNKNLYFKFGILEDNLYDNEQLQRISQLPSRNELLSSILTALKMPVYKLSLASKFNLIKLINILKEKSKQN